MYDDEYPMRADEADRRPEPDLLTDHELRNVCLALEHRAQALRQAIVEGHAELSIVLGDLARCASHAARRLLVVDRPLPRQFKCTPTGIEADFEHIGAALERAHYNREAAALELGMEVRTIYRRIREMRAAGWKIPRQTRRIETAARMRRAQVYRKPIILKAVRGGGGANG